MRRWRYVFTKVRTEMEMEMEVGSSLGSFVRRDGDGIWLSVDGFVGDEDGFARDG